MSGQYDVDPVLLEILKNAFISTCAEMGKAMQRAAYSPIFSEARDFTVALLDERAELVGQFAFHPAQLGAISLTVSTAVDIVGRENLEAGDILMLNDAYLGGTHLPEVTVFRPIFSNGELIGFAANMAHLVDIGGSAPGSFSPGATEIFQEGIRVPPVKIWHRDRPVEDVLRLFLNNVRVPRDIEGDLNALVASVFTGERRLLRLIEKYDLETVRSVFEGVKDYSERRIREGIRDIPDGVYYGEDSMDDDGIDPEPVVIRATVVKRGDSIIADFTGSDKQRKGAINASFGSTLAATGNAIIHLTDPDVPINHGCFRPVSVIAPPGTVVNVEYPGALVAGHTELSNHIVSAVVRALAPAVPDRVIAGSIDGFCNFTGGGRDPRTSEQYAFYWFSHGGWGARATKDGISPNGGIQGNARNIPVETIEVRYPWMIEELSFANDSGGPGTYRGGLGTIRAYKLLAPSARVNLTSDRHKIRAWGLFGGLEGGGTEACLRRGGELKPITEYGVRFPTKFMNFEMREGDCMVVQSPGGGGYGDPLLRAVSAVLEDVRNEYVSVESARLYYGVVINSESLEVDHEATTQLRAKLRAEKGEAVT